VELLKMETISKGECGVNRKPTFVLNKKIKITLSFQHDSLKQQGYFA